MPGANKLICVDRWLDSGPTKIVQIIGKFPQKFTPNLWPIIHKPPYSGQDLARVNFNGWLKLIPTYNVGSNRFEMGLGRTTIFRLTKNSPNEYTDDFGNPKENQILFYLEVGDDGKCSFKIKFTDFENFVVVMGKSEISLLEFDCTHFGVSHQNGKWVYWVLGQDYFDSNYYANIFLYDELLKKLVTMKAP